MYPIIDCHCHIYPVKIAEKATASIGKFYDLPMSYHGTAAEMIEKRRESGITHSVVFSVATKPQQVESINNFIAEEVAALPNLVGLGAVHPESENQEADIGHIISLGLKGVKLHPDIQGFDIDDPRCMKIYEICRERGLLVLIHMGDPRYDYSSPDRLVKVLDTFGDLKVIGAHFGGWGVWKEATEKLSKYQNLTVDCSSSFAFISPEEAKDIVRKYGAEKVIFGTDYPMWEYKAELERFHALGLTDEEEQMILYKNAAKLFGIEV